MIRALASAVVATLTIGCSTNALPRRDFTEARTAIVSAMQQEKIVGGVLHVEHDQHVHREAFGVVAAGAQRVHDDTIYDVASLTKVLATAPSIVLLQQQGRLRIDDPVRKYLPSFRGGLRDAVTLRHLLTHTSTLPAGLSRIDGEGYGAAIDEAMKAVPTNRPGVVFRYSDVNYILLGEIVRVVSGKTLDRFAHDEIFAPLGMRDTMFNPPRRLRPRIAPTSNDAPGLVHDPTARRMGGVAGHAGLFTTSADVALFARAMLNRAAGKNPFDADSLRLLTTPQTRPGAGVRRAAGFDFDSNYSRPRGDRFSAESFGHTGWTGSFLWIDPQSNAFYSFLSNRVMAAQGSVVGLQFELGDAVGRALQLPPRPFAVNERTLPRGGATVLQGIDVLEAHAFDVLRGKRVALVTNHSGRDRDGNSTIDVLRSAHVQLRALFAPEHGLSGALDERITDAVDAESALPVYSLYDSTPAPTAKELEGLDAIVFDIQDIGVRYYTYPKVLFDVLQAAASAHLQVVVLDRVNPLGGRDVRGPAAIERVLPSAFHPFAVVHAMTIGEQALMLARERQLSVDLQVVQLRGWKRAMWFDDADLAWISTSPNLRNMRAAVLYPTIGMLETANVSVGRGTDEPLEVVGAPYIDGAALALELNARHEAGVHFEPVTFVPRSREFQGQRCSGVRIVVENRETFDPLRVGLAIARSLFDRYGERFAIEKINVLLQDAQTISRLREGVAFEAIIKSWDESREAFLRRREAFLLYRD